MKMTDRALLIGVTASVLFHLCLLYLPINIKLKSNTVKHFQQVNLTFYSVRSQKEIKTAKVVKKDKAALKKTQSTDNNTGKIIKNRAEVKEQKVAKRQNKALLKREKRPVKTQKSIDEKETLIQKKPVPEKTIQKQMPQSQNLKREMENTTSDSRGLVENKKIQRKVSVESEKPIKAKKTSGDGKAATIFRGRFGESEGPRFLRKVIPRYPRLARRLGKEGAVLLKLFIDKEGRLKKVEVIKDDGYGFASSAVKAVRQSTFLPAIKNGVPVDSEALLTVRFRIKR
jgi:protein TonB